jgi:all-trans-retinol dehydrogenase (NAD+)
MLLPIIAVVTFSLVVIACTMLLIYHLRKRIDVTGTTVLVAGCAQGIGEHVVWLLCEKGVGKLVLVDIQDLAPLSAMVRQKYPTIVVIPHSKCDLAEFDHVKPLFADHGPISIVVNCAGVVTGERFADMDVTTTFARTMKVNLMGNVHLLKAWGLAAKQAPPRMFVCVSSLMGLMGGARLTDYCASKFAVVGFCEALRLEANMPSIAVVCPYVVDTGMFKGAFETNAQTRLIKRLFPFLSPRAVAESIVFTIERGLSITKSVPGYFGLLIGVARTLPSPLYEFCLQLMGGASGMDSFVGRRKEA